jgi:hypothetical protein
MGYFSFTQDVPADDAVYGKLVEGLGDELPKGLVVHIAMRLPDGSPGLRYVDVWESKEDWERFRDERLHPILHDTLREIFGDDLPPEPPQTVADVIHVWGVDASQPR